MSGTVRKGKKYPAEVLTKREMKKLLDALDTGSAAGKRNMVMFATMYRTGLRPGEVRDLQVKDVDLEEGLIHVLHGKGDKDRKVAVDGKLLEMLREYAAGLEGEYFFGNKNGGKLTAWYLNKTVQAAASDAGIKKRVSAHSFRHCHAYELLTEGVHPVMIKQQLGHADLATTMKYLDHLNPVERFEKLKAREW